MVKKVRNACVTGGESGARHEREKTINRRDNRVHISSSFARSSTSACWRNRSSGSLLRATGNKVKLDCAKMPRGRVNANFSSPNVDVMVDMGHPLLNRVVDGFLKVGGVGAVHALAQETYGFVRREETNKKSLEVMVQRMGKEVLQWGMVAGVYSGMTYGMQEARGTHDWKNALLGGVLTGAALSLADSSPRHENVISGAITGGAIATAAEFLRNIT